MANKLYEENDVMAIAEAIREKNGTENTYKVSQMADAVRAISGGDGITPSGSITITENGTVDITEYAEAVINVPTEGSEGIIPSGSLEIVENGTYDVTDYAQTVVNVPTGESGGSNLPSNMLSGTFTVDEDTQESQIITHNAGVVPTGILVMADELANPDALKSKTVGGMHLGRKEAVVFSNTGSVTYGATVVISDITETTFTMATRDETTYPFSAQLTYRWWVWF